MTRRRQKWRRRLRAAWLGLTDKGYLPPIGIRFTLNGQVILDSTSEDLYLMAKWGGTDEGAWREVLSPWPPEEDLQLLAADGDRLGLHVRWSANPTRRES